MNNNGHNIEKMNFDAFMYAIGSEIEQAQIRLITAANAQMLFHYWKMGNYILYHQATGKGYTVQLSRKERLFGTQPYLYVPIRTVISVECATKFH